jgi:hypothetical protein
MSIPTTSTSPHLTTSTHPATPTSTHPATRATTDAATPSQTRPATPRPTSPLSSRPTRLRSLRRFLRPYRGSLSLASGLILVETLIDLARPWPLKLVVDNAIGGQPLGGVLAVLNQLGPGGMAAVAVAAGSGWWGSGRWSGT